MTLFAAYSRVLCPGYVEVLNRHQSHLICSLTEVITKNNINTYIKYRYKKYLKFLGEGVSEKRSSHVGNPKQYFACPSGTTGSNYRQQYIDAIFIDLFLCCDVRTTFPSPESHLAIWNSLQYTQWRKSEFL